MARAGFLRSIDIEIAADLSPTAAALDFANRVRVDVAAEIAAGRAAPRYTRFVDGREGLPETAVKPGGQIFYEFGLMPEITIWALAFLRARSPVGRGTKGEGKRYRDSFFVGVGGKFVPMAQFRPELVPEDVQITIGNTASYNRKVDVQRIGNKKLRFSVEKNIYEDAVKAINKQFANFATATRLHSVDFPGRYALKQSQRLSGHRSHRFKRMAGDLVDSPALVITPR